MTTIHYAETPYGFEYGAAKIDRVCSDKKKGWVVLSLGTPKHQNSKGMALQMYVTKSGKVRIMDVHSEWKPVPIKKKSKK